MRRLMKALRRKWRKLVWWRNKRRGGWRRGISKLPEGWEEPYLKVFREADEIQFHKERN